MISNEDIDYFHCNLLIVLIFSRHRTSEYRQDTLIVKAIMSNTLNTAIEDPYGYGFEGRVAVDRHSSERRKHVATVIRQFSTHSLLAPVAVQYEYLLCYGYYTAEEMKDHPGRRK